jgi:hypothetical protein
VPQLHVARIAAVVVKNRALKLTAAAHPTLTAPIVVVETTPTPRINLTVALRQKHQMDAVAATRKTQ